MWQKIKSMERNEEKEREANDTSKFFNLNEQGPRVSFERKRK